MENRRKLHDSGLVLIIYGILQLFVFVGTIVDDLVDGRMINEIAAVDADIVVAVIVVLVIIGLITALLVGADILLGLKALKVSQNPNASKGYIIIAKIFMILSCIATISHAVALFGGNGGSAIDTGLNLASATLSVCIYLMFVTAADAVRKDVLNEAK